MSAFYSSTAAYAHDNWNDFIRTPQTAWVGGGDGKNEKEKSTFYFGGK